MKGDTNGDLRIQAAGQEFEKWSHDLICGYPRSNLAGKSFRLTFSIRLSNPNTMEFLGKETYITLCAQIKANHLKW